MKAYCFCGSKAPARVLAHPGEPFTRADLKVPKGARYIRISIVDAQGRYADTRAFFREELGLQPL